MSITSRLHMILILTIVGVVVYMFLLYKEIRIFEREVQTLKGQVASLMVKAENCKAVGACTYETKDEIYLCKSPQAVETDSVEAVIKESSEGMTESEDEDEDAESVTSNEIKDLLTNIHDAEEVIDDNEIKQGILRKQMEDVRKAEEEALLPPPPSVEGSVAGDDKDSSPKILTPVEVDALKYEELRSYLKQHNIVAKGTKSELLTKAKGLYSSI